MMHVEATWSPVFVTTVSADLHLEQVCLAAKAEPKEGIQYGVVFLAVVDILV